MARTTLVDGEEGEFGGSVDAELDPMLDTQETLAQTSEAARPSARALYVPSPLPMGELKKVLARAAEEEATSAAPTNPPPAPIETPAVPIDVPAAPLRPHIEPTPPPGFEKTIDRRFASVVDSEEVRAIGARVNARAQAIAVAKGINVNPQPLPLPSLDEFAPIGDQAPVQPVVKPAVQIDYAAKAAPVKKKRGWFATAMLFVLVLGLGGAAIAAALGKLTKDNALHALTTVRGAAAHVAQSVQRL